MRKSMILSRKYTLAVLAFATFLSSFGTNPSADGLEYEAIAISEPSVEKENEIDDVVIDETNGYVSNKIVIKYRHQGFRLFESSPKLPKRSGIASLKSLELTSKNTQFLGKALTFNETSYYEATLVEGLAVETAVNILQQSPSVEFAEPIYARNIDAIRQDLGQTYNSSLVDQQYYLDMVNLTPAQEFLESKGINPGGKRDVIVAVIDTGVDYNHEDLMSNMWVNTEEIPENGIDDDNNGWIDDIHGITTVGNEYAGHSGDPMDDHGHGTHVAGIIAADGSNAIGITGIAPNVRIMALKAGQQTGVLLTTDIVEAIDYARRMGADVINMSYGGYAPSQIEREALELAFNSSVLVAAAGNDGSTNRPHPQGKNMYPSSYPWVLGVMATDATNTLASFSNFDYKGRDQQEYEVAVPGSQILSTLPNNRYAKWSGTSMATPIVAGQAALLKSYFDDPMSHSSRFIMGQIIGTGSADVIIPARLKQLGLTLYTNYSGIDIEKSLKFAPKPELSLYDTFIWDKASISEENNGNGVIDAGETVQLALEIRNHWGKADNVNVTLDTKNVSGISNPYVTFNTDTINYGAVGTFNHDDNGFIYDENKEIVGIDEPFEFTVAKNAPNDYVSGFNVTMTGYNGLDPADTDM